MKTVCVYHSIDLDGWMSAAIVKRWFITQNKPNTYIIDGTATSSGGSPHNPNELDFIGYNYGQPIPDLSEYDNVIMCDISFPIEEMEKLRQWFQDNFIWLDHHISAINDNGGTGQYTGLQDTKFAACELTWNYFFPNEDIPEMVRLLGMYDSYRFKGTDEERKVLEFQYGARQLITNYKEAYEFLQMALSLKGDKVPLEHTVWFEGKSIYEYLCTEAKQVYKSGFVVEFDRPTFKGIGGQVSSGLIQGYKFICINRERFNPTNFGIDYHKAGYDGAACFHYANGVWNFSLYNDNGLVDCSIIAKQYGGGGHFSASGFRCDSDTFLRIINK